MTQPPAPGSSSAERLREWRNGYDLRPEDEHDLEVLSCLRDGGAGQQPESASTRKPVSLRNGATKGIPVALELKACHLGGLLLGGFCLDDDGFRAVDEGLAGSRSAQRFWDRTALRRRPADP